MTEVAFVGYLACLVTIHAGLHFWFHTALPTAIGQRLTVTTLTADATFQVHGMCEKHVVGHVINGFFGVQPDRWGQFNEILNHRVICEDCPVALQTNAYCWEALG